MTPTSGGSATGRATSGAQRRRPGKSARSKSEGERHADQRRRATTEASEIHSLRQSASHSSAGAPKARDVAEGPARRPAQRLERG